MRGNSFGKAFCITTYGESHGTGIGVIIDGCPAGLELNEAYINKELARRRPGQSSIVTQRKEPDEVRILSGIFEGKSTGTPISLYIENKNQKSKDYGHIKDSFRPSHADYTYTEKYGNRDYRGGGRSSARETAARVASGAIAKKLLEKQNIEITAFVTQVGTLKWDGSLSSKNKLYIEQNPVRVPNTKMALQMENYIKEVRKDGDTIGGIIKCVIENVPIGLGEPVFDKLHADLAKAMLSINAVKGFEYGSGFSCVAMKGSEHNDLFREENGAVVTDTNYSGGIQGGISNGMDIYFNTAFKPVATIMQSQKSIDKNLNVSMVEGKGRHDPCVVPRAVPIVEAMAALVLADHILRNRIVRMG